MDYKLQAINNNIDNDRIDLITHKQYQYDKYQTKDVKIASKHHVCAKNIPVIFSSNHGVHLRTFNENSPTNYTITFCDLERWSHRKNHVNSIGLSTELTLSTSGSSSAFQSIKLVQEASNSGKTKKTASS